MLAEQHPDNHHSAFRGTIRRHIPDGGTCEEHFCLARAPSNILNGIIPLIKLLQKAPHDLVSALENDCVGFREYYESGKTRKSEKVSPRRPSILEITVESNDLVVVKIVYILSGNEKRHGDVTITNDDFVSAEEMIGALIREIEEIPEGARGEYPGVEWSYIRITYPNAQSRQSKSEAGSQDTNTKWLVGQRREGGRPSADGLILAKFIQRLHRNEKVFDDLIGSLETIHWETEPPTSEDRIKQNDQDNIYDHGSDAVRRMQYSGFKDRYSIADPNLNDPDAPRGWVYHVDFVEQIVSIDMYVGGELTKSWPTDNKEDQKKGRPFGETTEMWMTSICTEVFGCLIK